MSSRCFRIGLVCLLAFHCSVAAWAALVPRVKHPAAAYSTCLQSAATKNTLVSDGTRLSLQQQEAPKHHSVAECVRSVNFHITRKCNYACKFCFHTQKTTDALSLEEASRGLALLRAAGTQKVNFAGGEPFLRPQLLGDLCRAAHELGMAVSIISNGSMITRQWMQQYGHFVDVLGVSIDSFDAATNAAIGRGDRQHGGGDLSHVKRILDVREWCREQSITFKVNTVVCQLNWQENMTVPMLQLDPARWKVFQVLVLKGENSGTGGDLRNAEPLRVTAEEDQSFVQRHQPQFPHLVPEPNEVMQNSYLMLDERMRFLDCSTGGKVATDSILAVGVPLALAQAGFDLKMFHHRGGVFDWTRDRPDRQQ